MRTTSSSPGGYAAGALISSRAQPCDTCDRVMTPAHKGEVVAGARCIVCLVTTSRIARPGGRRVLRGLAKGQAGRYSRRAHRKARAYYRRLADANDRDAVVLSRIAARRRDTAAGTMPARQEAAA